MAFLEFKFTRYDWSSLDKKVLNLQVIEVINTEALPLLKRCSLAGHAELKTHNPIFSEHPLAADMLMDVLTDRGFATTYFMDEQIVPESIDLKTGQIKNKTEYMHHFRYAIFKSTSIVTLFFMYQVKATSLPSCSCFPCDVILCIWTSKNMSKTPNVELSWVRISLFAVKVFYTFPFQDKPASKICKFTCYNIEQWIERWGQQILSSHQD